jgi:eukaryotic-like serine/threonine-protein kinase
VKKLGEGGMGQVWLAEQTAPLQRQVALKLIKVGMYDDSVLQRFQSERQSLAIMEHPMLHRDSMAYRWTQYRLARKWSS